MHRQSRSILGHTVALTMTLLARAPLAAEFIDPVEVAAPGGANSAPRAAGSIVDAISIVYERDGQVYFASSLIGFGTEVQVTDDGTENGSPALATGILGLSYVLYEQEDPSGTGRGTGLVLADNNGGPFKNFVTVADSEVDEREPVLVFGPTGVIDVAWIRVPDGGPSEVYFSHDQGDETLVAEGNSPTMAATAGGAAHLVYVRAGDLFYRRFFDDAFEDEIPLPALTGDESSPALMADGTGVLHLVFLNDGQIYYTNDDAGSFAEPTSVVTGPVTAPFAWTGRGDNRLVLAYASAGEIEFVERVDGAFGGATSATPASRNASAPAVVVDSHGYLHFAFVEDGGIYYTTDTPAPVANFTADVLSGEVPLDVAFSNTTTGVFTSTEWTFGDGESSLNEAPSHTYLTTGKKTVTLEVIGPGGSSTKTRVNYIDCQAPTNILALPPVNAFQGLAVTHPVYATHPQPLQGFLLRFTYDNDFTPITDITFQASVTDPLDPEFLIENNDPDADEPSLLVSVILDINTPFDGRTIPPGTKQILLSLKYQIPIGVSLGNEGEIRFTDDATNRNHFDANFEDIGTVSVEPFLVHGPVSISTLPTVTFLRGDANLSGIIDLADPIFVLGWMFANGTAPACPDAADFNDSGSLDLADPIGCLNFQFAEGAPPAYPFPAPGLDSTTDTLDACDP